MSKRHAPAASAPASAPNNKWYQIRAAADESRSAEVLIFGDIGANWWGGESVIASELIKELNALDVDELTVRINSYGGSVSDGVAIHNAVRRHKAQKTVVVEGVAVSIASLIAMAGDSVQMHANSLMMIHAPWGFVQGNAVDMREMADVLDSYATAMAASYARKTGKPVDVILPLLTDGADHWYTADEAKSEGFADEVLDALPIAAHFDMNRFSIPAAVAAMLKPLEVLPMPDKAKTPAVAADNPPADTQTTANVMQIEAAVQARIAARNAEITASFKPFLARDGVQALMTECLADPNLSTEQARAKLLAKLGEGAEPLNPQSAGSVEITRDERDKFVEAAGNMLLARAGVHRMRAERVPDLVINLSGNPFRGATLLDLARAALRRNGINPDGLDKREVVAKAFQTTSDFPVLLENTLHKVLQRAYATAPDTWRRFCAIGSVSDFRAHNRYRVGSIGNLDALNEHGEFKRKTIPDGEKASITAGTKGNIIAITREAIINDDLDALTGLAIMLGRAAARTIEALVYSRLAENSGAGPLLSDGKALFHADHGNIEATTVGAPSVATIEACRVLMAVQKDVSGNDYLDLRPALWLGPIGLGGDARVVNDAQYDPDTANKLQKPNKVRGLVRDIVDTPRLTGNPWYLFADAADAPVMEVAFLDGNEDPYLESQNGWDVDGAELKVRLDFGVAGVDYRGAVKNNGA